MSDRSLTMLLEVSAEEVWVLNRGGKTLAQFVGARALEAATEMATTLDSLRGRRPELWGDRSA